MRVPFGRQAKIGVVVDLPEHSDFAPEQLKSVEAVLRDLPPLPADWFRCEFCAAYYQAPLGEVMISTLPAGLRRIDPPKARTASRCEDAGKQTPPELTHEQLTALERIASDDEQNGGFRAYLLHGVTGGGKARRSICASSSEHWPLAVRSCCWCRKSISRRNSKHASRRAFPTPA